MGRSLLPSPYHTGWALPHLNYFSELYRLRVIIPTQRLTHSLCTLHVHRYRYTRNTRFRAWLTTSYPCRTPPRFPTGGLSSQFVPPPIMGCADCGHLQEYASFAWRT